MTVLRVIFFRLYESPRYLVAAGRPTEAMENLQLISKFNGEELDLSLRDVRDHSGTIRSRRSHSYSTVSPVRDGPEEEQPFLPTASPLVPFIPRVEKGNKTSGSTPDSADYNTTGETSTIRNNKYSFTTPTLESHGLPTVGSPSSTALQVQGHDHQRNPTGHSAAGDEEDDERKITLRSPLPLTRTSRSRRSSISVSYKHLDWLPRFIRKPLWAYLERISLVLAPEWFWKTLTVWAMWFSMALGAFLWFGFPGDG